MKRIFWASDSSVETLYYDSFPRQGIGQVFYLFTKPEYVIENHAHGGRSSKSFINEGRLKAIEEKLEEGDFLFILFAGNDEKEYDPARYTEPYTTFIEYLEIYIKAAREHGAYPVLITPAERRCFDEHGKLGPGAHADYVKGMKLAAEKNYVPLVDLYTMSRAALEKAGEVKSREWYMYFEAGTYEKHPEESRDNSHFRFEGAVMHAGMIAEGLKNLGGIYADIVREDI